MRQKNGRLVIAGSALIVIALLFHLSMLTASRSNDPRALMEIVGQVSGAVGASAS